MPLRNDTLISVLVVLNNDSDIIDDFIHEATKTLSCAYRYYEVLLVDNSSTDDTSDRIQALQKKIPNLRLLRLSRRYDTETALTAALDNSIGDYVVIMNPAYDPPTMIPALIEQAANGYDVVIAQLRDRKRQPLLRRWLSVAFYKIASLLLRQRLQPNETQFRAFSRQVVNSLTRIGNKHRYLKYLNALIGYKQMQLTYERVYRPRLHNSEPGLFQLVLSAMDIIISNSAVPLRLASLLGLSSSFLSLIYCGYVLLVSLIKNKVAEGWLTTNLMLTVMFMMMFLILTILSEYIARILEESRDRPLYFVEYETTSTVASYKEEVMQKVVNVV